MNKHYVLFHLKEAAEQLEETIGELQSAPDYDFGEYMVDMSHLYHHVNTAWNARDESKEVVEECSEENFNKWRAFPSIEELFLES